MQASSSRNSSYVHTGVHADNFSRINKEKDQVHQLPCPQILRRGTQV